MDNNQLSFITRLADDVMILGQRLGEWCGHGPVLEQDIAMTNIALDLIGEARLYYQYLAEIEGKKEDDYPMLRDVRSFKNILLVEQPNGHWGDTIIRQFMFDSYHFYMLQALTTSRDERLAAIAQKSVKEASYQLSFSSEWVIRLGDGTEESNTKMQHALNDFVLFMEEAYMPAPYETECMKDGFCPDLSIIRQKAFAKFKDTLDKATLQLPAEYASRTGGKTGMHSEHLGYILADMQYMQRAYPNATW